MAIAAMRVPTIFVAVDRFSDVVTKMTMRTSAFGKTAEAAAMRTSRSFNSAGNNMLGAGIGIATGIGFAVNEAAKFEKSIASVSTLTNNTPAEMKKIGDSILDMSKKIPVSMSDLTTGMYDTVSAGITGTANQLGVLNSSAILAVSGLGTVKESVNITTSSLNAFGIEASKSSQVTNLLMKAVKYGKTTVSGISESFGAFASIMKNSNVSLEEYLATSAALTTTGMSMSRAQTQVSSATTALIKPNKSMMEIYKRLGVKDVPTFIKKSGGLVAALELVNKEAGSMGMAMSKVMGRKEGLSALLSLLGAQKGKFHEIMNDMVGGADMVDEAFGKQQATLSAKIQRMKNDMTVLAIKIGDVLIPRIKDLVDSIIPTIEKITAWSERNKGFANTLMTVAKWLLILGVTAKVGAFLFYGLSKALAFATFVSEGYAFATQFVAAAQLAQAFSGASLSMVMWELAASLLAVYWPVLLILGALGLLAYSMSDSIGSTEDMVSKQMSALGKGNQAWMNSTSVMKGELAKQRNMQIANNPAQNKQAKASSLVAIGDRFKEQVRVAQLENLQLPASMRMPEGNVESAVRMHKWNFKDTRFADSSNRPKNLAGSSASNSYESLKAGIKDGTINVVITAPDGYGATAESKDIKGIQVHTKSNQGTR